MTSTCTKVLALLYLALLKVLFAPIGLRTRFRPMFADVNLSNLTRRMSNYGNSFLLVVLSQDKCGCVRKVGRPIERDEQGRCARVISLELAIAVSNYAHIIRTLGELGDSHTRCVGAAFLE